MQQPIARSVRRLITAAAATILLTQAVWAADYQIAHGEIFQLHREDFTTNAQVDGIYVRAVPTTVQGSFYYGVRSLSAGDVLPAAALDAITLQASGTQETELTLQYCPIQNGKLAEPMQLTIAVCDKKATAPIAHDAKLETYKNIPNNGKLHVEGGTDSNMTYQLVRAPKRGTVAISDDGTYLYTPKENKVGTDHFTYTVTDAAGTVSNEATVTVKIQKPDAAAYADLDGDYDQFEAMWLQASGLFTGEMLSGQYCFEPDTTFTRGDFLVMLMQVAGLKPDAAQTTSGFSDESQAPLWMQPYLSAALRCGISGGIQSEDGLLFAPNQPVTCAQAVVMTQNALQLPLPESTAVFAEDTHIPVWAQSAVQALHAADLTLDCSDYDRALTRREAAQLLYQAHQLLTA